METCDAIWNQLAPTEMPVPTREDWIKIEREFSNFWNFPNCVGSLDGKHVVITSPPDSGSLFFNYKQTFSTNLMALQTTSSSLLTLDNMGVMQMVQFS